MKIINHRNVQFYIAYAYGWNYIERKISIWSWTSPLIICTGRTSGEEVSLCRNEVSSLSHWSSRSTKQQHTIHSHVFDLYSTGGNGAASCLWCLLLTRSEKPFLLFRRRRSRLADPLRPSADADLNASYVFANTPATLLSERTVDKHSPPRVRHDFHPPANKKSRVHASPIHIRRRNRRRRIPWE